MPGTFAKRPFASLLLLIIVVFSPIYLFGEENAATEQNQSAKQTEPAEQNQSVKQTEPAEQKLDLIEVYKWSNSLPKELIDLQIGVESLADISHLEEQLPEIATQIEDLEWDAVPRSSQIPTRLSTQSPLLRVNSTNSRSR